jgi:hypothetical protein
MRSWNQTAAIALTVAVVTFGAGAALAGGAGRPTHAKGDLAIPTTPVAGPDADARGVVEWKHFPVVGKRAERSWLRFRLGRLDGADNTLWMDDPSTPETDLVQVTTLTAVEGDNGFHLNYRIDTKHGGVLPFGATLDALVGMAIEIRDASGATVLAGAVPAVQVKPPHGHGH